MSKVRLLRAQAHRQPDGRSPCDEEAVCLIFLPLAVLLHAVLFDMSEGRQQMVLNVVLLAKSCD